MPRFKFPKYTLAVVLVLTAAFFIYFPSYSRYRELKSEADHLQVQLKELQKQIEDLQREKQLIKNDKNYLENVIRKEMGLVEPGEVVYEFENKPRKQVTAVPPVVKTADLTPERG